MVGMESKDTFDPFRIARFGNRATIKEPTDSDAILSFSLENLRELRGECRYEKS